MTYLLVKTGDVLSGVGLKPKKADGFILGVTMPTMQNTGAVGTFTPYPGSNISQSVFIDTPGAVFENIDFGNIRLKVRTTNVTFRNCRWNITDNKTAEPMLSTNSASALNCLIEFCTFNNLDQMGHKFNAIEGHDILVYRCKITGTCDGIRASLGGNVRIHGNFIGELGWWGTFSGGPTLNSGFQTHSDCIQTNYGAGMEVIGNSLWAYPSETVGTGTPNSGTDTGNTDSWYTQAQAKARRTEVLDAYPTNASKSADGVSHGVGGILCGIMLTFAQGPSEFNLLVTDNWFAGGSVQVNALDTALTGNLGTFLRNKHYNDSAYKVAGNAIGYRLNTPLIATIPTTGPDVNTYVDGSGTVTRV